VKLIFSKTFLSQTARAATNLTRNQERATRFKSRSELGLS